MRTERRRPKTRSDLTVVELDGEAVIYDSTGQRLHHLNPSASVIFSMLDGTTTIGGLAAGIADAFGLPREELEPQVRTAVDDFHRAGLLEDALGPGG